MNNDTEIYIDTACNENCYAVGWSFGEICVNCGCCSDDLKTRYKNRIDYHFDMLHDSITVNGVKYHKNKIAEYQEKLKRLNENE